MWVLRRPMGRPAVRRTYLFPIRTPTHHPSRAIESVRNDFCAYRDK